MVGAGRLQAPELMMLSGHGGLPELLAAGQHKGCSAQLNAALAALSPAEAPDTWRLWQHRTPPPPGQGHLPPACECRQPVALGPPKWQARPSARLCVPLARLHASRRTRPDHHCVQAPSCKRAQAGCRAWRLGTRLHDGQPAHLQVQLAVLHAIQPVRLLQPLLLHHLLRSGKGALWCCTARAPRPAAQLPLHARGRPAALGAPLSLCTRGAAPGFTWRLSDLEGALALGHSKCQSHPCTHARAGSLGAGAPPGAGALAHAAQGKRAEQWSPGGTLRLKVTDPWNWLASL